MMVGKLQERVAFMFPGVGMDFRKYISLLDDAKRSLLVKFCDKAKEQTGIDVWNFIFNTDEIENDADISGQIVCYIINCLVFQVYRDKGIYPHLASGYSMGIYSAAACGEAITFETGLDLVVNAYECMKKCMTEKQGSMAFIIGLTRENVQDILKRAGFEESIQIVNENNEYSIVVSGLKENIGEFIGLARSEGALKTEEIVVSLPYHSSFLKAGADAFLNYIQKVNIENMKFPLVSSINQEIIRDSEELRNEFYMNLRSSLSWKQAIEKMMALGIKQFFEAGTGDGLSRVSRFISSASEFFCYKDVAGETLWKR